MPFDFSKGIHLAVDTLCEAEVLSSGLKCARKYSSSTLFHSFMIILKYWFLKLNVNCKFVNKNTTETLTFRLALASHRTGCYILWNVSSVIGFRREFWVIESSFGPRFARKKRCLNRMFSRLFQGIVWGSEWGDPLVGCRLKFSYFVGCKSQLISKNACYVFRPVLIKRVKLVRMHSFINSLHFKNLINSELFMQQDHLFHLCFPNIVPKKSPKLLL